MKYSDLIWVPHPAVEPYPAYVEAILTQPPDQDYEEIVVTVSIRRYPRNTRVVMFVMDSGPHPGYDLLDLFVAQRAVTIVKMPNDQFERQWPVIWKEIQQQVDQAGGYIDGSQAGDE